MNGPFRLAFHPLFYTHCKKWSWQGAVEVSKVAKDISKLDVVLWLLKTWTPLSQVKQMEFADIDIEIVIKITFYQRSLHL